MCQLCFPKETSGKYLSSRNEKACKAFIVFLNFAEISYTATRVFALIHTYSGPVDFISSLICYFDKSQSSNYDISYERFLF